MISPTVWHALWTSWDAWVLTLLLVIVSPALDYFIFRALKARPAPPSPHTKIKLFLYIILSQWILTGLTVVIMYHHGANLSDIGQQLGRAPWTVGVTLIVVLSLFLLTRRNRTQLSKTNPDRLKRLLQNVGYILPTSPAERPVFVVLAVTAGICEEILFRGWLVSFLTGFGHLWLAVILSSILFGAAHLYQGVKAVPSTALLGLVFALLFVATGSLLPGQALHTFIDVNNGLSLGKMAAGLQAESA